MTLLDAALTWHSAGYTPVPIVTTGEKRPIGAWKHLQEQPPTAEQVARMFNVDTDGIGVICGKTSGNLEMFEMEGRAVAEGILPALVTLLTDHGLADLWRRIDNGYVELTPSGGLHWHYRVDGGARGNTKLAKRPATPEELAANPDDKIKVLVETRGHGGFTVVAPSQGRTHPTGAAWMRVRGDISTIPTITVDERDALYAIASMLDQMPAIEEKAPVLGGSTPGTRPGDDFNARATWDDILVGWTRVRHFGGNCYGWTRPGKHPRDGISATTGRNDGDNLYVFSTSTEFESEKAYSKFAAYTLLEHNGDYSAAAKALAGLGYGKQEEPRPVEAPTSPPTLTVVRDDDPPLPSSYSLTDDGNALRLVDAHRDVIRYCPEAGSWFRWDGHRWAWDTGGHVHELARGIARALPADDKADQAHRRRSLSNIGLKGMVNVARTDVRILVSPDQLDGRPYELNTPAGVVNLATGELRPPDPAALHTRSTPIAPDFAAECPRWARFLADTFAGDPQLTTYVQRLLGLSLIGEHLEQILPFGWGSGANGKSTLMNVAQGVVGIGQDGYSIPAPAELLLASHQRSHPTELARLSGARLVVASELEDGERFAESRIKMLTGGENIAARFMGKDFFSFKPTHTIWLLANDQPAVRAGGPAFWRRLRLLPFVHVVPPAERVTGLDHQLVDSEGPAILAWLIQGAIDYLASGLAEPESVRAATGAYEKDQDTVARFVEECCETGPTGAQHMTVRVAALRQAYETWCRQEGETPVSAKALTSSLTARFGVVSHRTMSARFYAGIRLTDVSCEVEPESSDGWWQQ